MVDISQKLERLIAAAPKEDREELSRVQAMLELAPFPTAAERVEKLEALASQIEAGDRPAA